MFLNAGRDRSPLFFGGLPSGDRVRVAGGLCLNMQIAESVSLFLSERPREEIDF